MNEQIVLLKQGFNFIQGIYHLPINGNDNKIGVLFCNAGLAYNIGIGRLYVSIARALTESGFHVLRFDPQGIGDSDGSFEEFPVKSLLYNKIEQGFFVDDTTAMCDFFLKIAPVKSIILLGFCGGGITAMLTAQKRLNKVAGIIAGSVPVQLEANNTKHFYESMTEDTMQLYRANYLKNFFVIESWKRLFKGDIDFQLLLRVLKFKKTPPKQIESIDKLMERVPSFNRILAESYCQIAEKKIPLLFLYGSHDKLRGFFEEYFLMTFPNQKGPFKNTYQYTIIKNGDHNFCWPDAKRSMMKVVLDWTNQIQC